MPGSAALPGRSEETAMATRRPKAAKKSKGRARAGQAGRAAKASKRPARKASARAARPKAAAGSGSALAAFARKIVRATQDPSLLDLRDLYAEGCVSREATGNVDTGFAGLEAKNRRWEAMQERSEWKPRKVWSDGNAICIEWDATVYMRDGRVVPFAEVAVHEVRDGKIVAERYYYNPMALAPRS
jgi:ketosteroid isomerase-like protein